MELSAESGSFLAQRRDFLRLEDDDNDGEEDFRFEFCGRDDELQTLLDAFERICGEETTSDDGRPSSEVILLCGEAGSGKTRLFEEFTRRVEDRAHSDETYVIEGKFEQREATKPLSSGLFDALYQLCAKLQESNRHDEVREALENNPSAPLLQAFLPPLASWFQNEDEVEASEGSAEEQEHPEQIQAPVSTLETSFPVHLLQDALRSFLRDVARSTQPIVLFVDDLQFSDDASLELVSSLVEDHRSKRILMVLACREDEMDGEKSDFHKRLMAGNDRPAPKFQCLTAAPFGVEEIGLLLARLTKRSLNEISDLSKLVLSKTGGNAFFVWQYVEHLHRLRFIEYSFEQCQWTWNLVDIQNQTNVSDNVVDLLIEKLQELDPAHRFLIGIASLLGHTFDLGVVHKLIAGETFFQFVLREDFDQAIAALLKSRLIEQMSPNLCKFSHDRVQQASLSLLPNDMEHRQLQWRLGLALVGLYKEDSSPPRLAAHGDWMLFSGISLLRKYSSEFASRNELVETAALHLEAGRLCEARSAFSPARDFALKGIRLLDANDMWSENYELCLGLHNSAMSTSRTVGRTDEALSFGNVILQHGRHDIEKLTALHNRMTIFGMQKKMELAHCECIKALEILGMKLPRKANSAHVLMELVGVKSLMRGRKPRDILELKTAREANVTTVCSFLKELVGFSFFRQELALFMFVSLRIMKLTLRKGLTGHSPFATAVYGLIQASLGNLRAGFEFGEVAIEMSNRLSCCCAHAMEIIANFLNHLQLPAQKSLGLFVQGHRSGMRHGLVDHAAMNLGAHAVLILYLGAPYESVEVSLRNHIGFCKEYNMDFAAQIPTAWLQTVLNLQGKSSDPFVLTGEMMDEQRFIENLKRDGTPSTELIFYCIKQYLSFLLGDLATAEAVLEDRIDKEAHVLATSFMQYFVPFLSGLTRLVIARKRPQERRRQLRKTRGYIRSLERFARQGNLNAPVTAKLLKTELKSFDPKHTSSMISLFDDSISTATRAGFRLVKALAMERAGEWCMRENDFDRAGLYISQCLDEYRDLSAQAKVRQLEDRYNVLERRPQIGMTIKFEKAMQTEQGSAIGLSAQMRPKYAATNLHQQSLDFSLPNVSNETNRTPPSFEPRTAAESSTSHV